MQKKNCKTQNKDQLSDEKIKKSSLGKRNRRKGNKFELEIVNKLKQIGYTGCKSSRAVNKMADANKIDVVDLNGELPCNIQTKNTISTPRYFAIRDACTDKDKPFCVIWKKTGTSGHNSEGTIAMIPLDYFLELISKNK